jgi:hypothetical protein
VIGRNVLEQSFVRFSIKMAAVHFLEWFSKSRKAWILVTVQWRACAREKYESDMLIQASRHSKSSQPHLLSVWVMSSHSSQWCPRNVCANPFCLWHDFLFPERLVRFCFVFFLMIIYGIYVWWWGICLNVHIVLIWQLFLGWVTFEDYFIEALDYILAICYMTSCHLWLLHFVIYTFSFIINLAHVKRKHFTL